LKDKVRGSIVRENFHKNMLGNTLTHTLKPGNSEATLLYDELRNQESPPNLPHPLRSMINSKTTTSKHASKIITPVRGSVQRQTVQNRKTQNILKTKPLPTPLNRFSHLKQEKG
jgi:hypothetical protein